jgi:UDP-GlcNAc:undecaprenyl-phosphate/decaprenyl-phosphate GlcNAc-1-phosphate transferase
MIWAIPCLVFAISIFAVFAFMPFAAKDAPDGGRKTQERAVPTSGGLGAMVALGLGAGLAAFTVPTPFYLPMAAFALGFGFLGAIDDVKPVSARLRLVLQTIIAAVFVKFVASAWVFSLTPDIGWELWAPLAMLGSALWLVVMVNTANFMDGANGLSLGSIAIGLLGLAAIAAFSDSIDGPGIASIALTGVAALAGILVWNFPRGLVFAGDSGAFLAGGFAGGLSLIAIQQGIMEVWIAPILFFPLLADVLLTILWRASKRLPLMSAHTDHHYQVARSAGASHLKVTLVMWGLSAHAALCAVAASFFPGAAGLFVLLVFIALSAWVSRKARRYAAAFRGSTDGFAPSSQ